MKVTQDEIVERQAVLQIEMEPEDMESFLERAYRRLVQRATIPGFRKGKAPRRILERFLGREALLAEAIDFLVPETTARAVEAQQLDAVANPLVDVVQLDPAILKATVPLKPVVHLGNYRDLRLEKETVQVTEEDVQQALEELRRTTAPWEPVDRPVQEDDLITMHVRAEVEGEVLADQRDITYLVREDSDRPFAGFAGHILEIAPQETKEFTATLPDTYEDPQTAGKEAHFTVTVLEVKERRLPELDDEFAKGVAEGYDSIAALREHIEQDLRAQRERAAEERLQEQALEKTIEESTVELPPLLIDHEIEHRLEDHQQSLARGGLSMEAYLQSVGKSPEELQTELKEQAIPYLTRAWVLAQVAEEEGLAVTPEEMEMEVDQLAEGAGQQGEAVRQAFARQETRESLSRMVLARKTAQRLAQIARGQLDQAPTRDSPPAEAAPAEGAEGMAKEQTTEGGTADAEQP